MGIGKKITKGIIGSGVNLSHKAPPMSGETGRLLNNMPLLKNNSGPGNYGGLQVEKSGIVGKGFMKAKQSYGGAATMLGDLDKNGVMSSYETNRQKVAFGSEGTPNMGGMEKPPMSTGMSISGKPKPKPKKEASGDLGKLASGLVNLAKNVKSGKRESSVKNEKKNEVKEVTKGEPVRKKVKTVSAIKDKPTKVQPVQEIKGVKPTAKSKIKASTLKTDVKKETDIEKAKRLTVESGKKSGLSEKTKSLSRKAKRLEKKSKRKEGRAERKNIRKKAKEGKIIEGKSGEYNSMSKREKIRQSRKDQKKK